MLDNDQLLHIQKEAFPEMERRYRTRLINALSGFKSLNLLGTVSTEGVTNLSVLSSVVHLGANPALMGFIMRPVSVTRDSYNNIMATGYFTFNHVLESFYQNAHQASARYPSEVSEFSATDLTAVYSDRIKAPYVRESKVRIGLAFREQLNIEANNTILMVGEVVEIFCPEECLQEDGYLDIEQAGTVTVSGLDSYHQTQRLARLSYAKPDQTLEVIS